MTDKSPIAVLERFYAAERVYMASPDDKAAFDAFAATMSPSLVLHQSPDLPWGGDYHGIEGFKKWAAQMGSTFSVVDVQDPQFLERKDPDGNGGQVVVSCTVRSVARLTGEEMKRPMIQVINVADGKITELRPFYWNVPDYVKAFKGEKVGE